MGKAGREMDGWMDGWMEAPNWKEIIEEMGESEGVK